MLTILLVRSGLTEYDCQGRIQGTLDVPLSGEGRQQAEATAQELAARGTQIDALYAGPCLSAQQTAEVLATTLKQKPKTLKTLHNLDQGLWQGMLFDDVKSKQPRVFRQWQERPDTVCPPEGETLREAGERLKAAIAKLTKKHKSGTIALVLAQPLASVLRSLLQANCPPTLCQSACVGKPLWEPIELAAAI
ncbi:histidine phosphatase family protein [Lacipirellula sp.]|uniref:histidine phosphatase family protein n=1 Tax=Lacipirellula sp. TaxID=2691419 RepID=UPI003D0CE077